MTRYVNIRGPAGYVIPSDDSLAGLPNHNVKSTPLTHEEMNRNLVTIAGAVSDLEKYQLPSTAPVSGDEGKIRYNAAIKEVELNDGTSWGRTAEFESHQHPQSDIIGLELGIGGAIASKADIASPNFLGAPTAPTTPTAQTGNGIATLDFVHANDDILQTAIDGKANSVHGHAISEVSGLQGELDLKASLADLADEVSDVVRTTGVQIISGQKTFLDDVKVSKLTGEARVEAVWGGSNASSCYVYNTSGSAGLYDSVEGPIVYSLKATNDTVLRSGAGGAIQFHVGSTNYGNVSALGNLTMAGDAYFNGVRVGKGSGGVATNTTVGFESLLNNTTGYYNISIGYQAMRLNTAGESNVAIGAGALYTNSTGDANVALGRSALVSNANGSNNTAVGHESLGLAVSTGANTAIGYQALGNTTSGFNTATGWQALISNSGGSYNTAVGVSALFTSISHTNSTGVGYATVVTGSNQVQLGDSSTTTYVFGTVQNRSDLRDKADVRDTALGLDFIESLRPVDYKWDMRDSYRNIDRPQKPIIPEDSTPEEIQEIENSYKEELDQFIEESKLINIVRDGSKKRNRYHHGLIAQEVKELLDSKGIDFGGFQDHKVSGGEDVLSIGYDELIAPLIKAVQELSAKVKELEATVSANSAP